MSQIFISYAKEDSNEAKKLYDDLCKLGYQVWLDAVSLVGGQNWEHEIKKAIGDSVFFIALISVSSLSKRGYVQKELKEALKVMELLPDNDIYIIPVRLDHSVPIYEKLRQIHWIDIYQDWGLGVKEIDRAIYLQRPDIKRSIAEQVEIADVNLNEIVTWAINVSKAGSEKIDIILNASDPSLSVKANINYLRQAVLNIILNAIKYSFIYEDKSLPWVDIKLLSSGEFATIAVQNCGIPITEDELKNGLLFNPFYIGTHAAKEGHDGTGLGLAVTKRIVEMFNGNITIESLPATTSLAGSEQLQAHITTVTLQLPLSGQARTAPTT